MFGLHFYGDVNVRTKAEESYVTDLASDIMAGICRADATALRADRFSTINFSAPQMRRLIESSGHVAVNAFLDIRSLFLFLNKVVVVPHHHELRPVEAACFVA